MDDPRNIFDASIAQWKAEQATPWARMKYSLVQANLANHFNLKAGRVLDAGGGNGVESIPLARQGFSVDLVDSSAAMLAEAADSAKAANVAERISLHQADVNDLATLFAGHEFDLVLCHNVIQYVADLPRLLADLAGLLGRGGVLSLVSINRFSIPYKTAFFKGNLEEALGQLDARIAKAYMFDVNMTCYAAEELGELVRQAGLVVENDYGVRCIGDYWGDNEQKSDPVVHEQLERLELALSGRYPYKLLARYFHIIARRP